MKINDITKRIFIMLIIVVLIFNLFIITVSADVIWYTDEYVVVGNENYTVNQTMNFSYREYTSEYLLLNNTYYNISSPETINITLDYLHENISNTTNGDLVLGFYINISGSSGNVWVNLSGFTIGYNYTIYREGAFYGSRTANSSGDISFDISNWSPSNPVYTVFNNEGIVWYYSSFGGEVEVTAEEVTPTWYSGSFGGEVTVIESEATWYSSSFGGQVIISGFGSWSEYWKVGQTIVYDCTDPLDLIVNTDDINVTVNNLTLIGTPGWILADVNDDGVINYLDISGVCFYYPWDYSE